MVNGSISPPAADDRNCTKTMQCMFLHACQKRSVFGAHGSPSEILLLRTHLLGHHSSGRLAEYESLFLSEIIQFLIISLRSEKVWLLSTYSQVLWQWQLEKHKKANYFYTCQCNCVHSSAKTTFWDNR